MELQFWKFCRRTRPKTFMKHVLGLTTMQMQSEDLAKRPLEVFEFELSKIYLQPKRLT